jgi:nicotinate-nucleotide pyrophosphorylase (carboxylating)
MMLPVTALDVTIESALAEDLGAGDTTTEAIIEEKARGIARAVAKAPLVVCGGGVFERVFHRLDAGLRVETELADGARADPGDALWTVRGAMRSILAGERTALNFAQHLSGIATHTARYVAAIPPGSSLVVADTGRTTPGLGTLERWAVRCGGGSHRGNLGTGVLIKDNHAAAAGGVGKAIRLVRERASHLTRIEVEVASLAELEEALQAGADWVMLDNFRPAELEAAVRRAKGHAVVEVSGGATRARIPELARLGVDVVSGGAITHSAPAVEISLELERC